MNSDDPKPEPTESDPQPDEERIPVIYHPGQEDTSVGCLTDNPDETRLRSGYMID